MSGSFAFFGDLEVDDVLNQWRTINPTTREALVIGGAFTLIILLVLLWAVYIRKPKRKHHSHRRSHDSSSASPEPAEAEESSRHRRKWRRPRRPHRQMNPTLSKTGGLPPVRNPAPPDSLF